MNIITKSSQKHHAMTRVSNRLSKMFILAKKAEKSKNVNVFEWLNSTSLKCCCPTCLLAHIQQLQFSDHIFNDFMTRVRIYVPPLFLLWHTILNSGWRSTEDATRESQLVVWGIHIGVFDSMACSLDEKNRGQSVN